MTSKCGKNKKGAASVSLMFLPHFDICDLLLNRRTATWNLFVLYNEQKGTTTNLPRNAWLFDLCQLRYFQINKNTFCLVGFFFFLFVNSSYQLFFRPPLVQFEITLANIFKTACHVGQNKENYFPVTSSLCLYSNRSWATTNHSALSIQCIVSFYLNVIQKTVYNARNSHKSSQATSSLNVSMLANLGKFEEELNLRYWGCIVFFHLQCLFFN